MKNKLISWLFIITLVIPCCLIAQDNYQISEAITLEKNQITVGVNPQIELISIVQTISKYNEILPFLMVKGDFQYKTDVINHFKSYKEHPVIQMFDRLSSQPRMLNFNAPSFIMLYTDKSLDLRKDIELDDFVINRAAGKDSLTVFLKLLTDFAVKSSFNDFYNNHSTYYKKVIENTIANMGSNNDVVELEQFYGKKQKSYNIVLVSLYNSVGFGNSLLCANNQREIYNIMGPKSIEEEIPFFGDEERLSYMIKHEFSHPFVNPLTDKYWEYIKDFSDNYSSIPELARKKVCGDWQECINEFIIRANTIQMAYSKSNEEGLKIYESERSRGVSYLDNLLVKIRYYQTNRHIFPTLESYYLEILEVFKEKEIKM